MPTHPLDGTEQIQLTGRMLLRPAPTLRGTALLHDSSPRAGVLGATGEAPALLQPTLRLDDFHQAQPPVELMLAPPSRTRGGPQVLGGIAGTTQAEMATIEFQPDPGEEAVYVMLHEIHTMDGIVYDVSLPQSGLRGAILGPDDDLIPDMLRFPIYGTIAPAEPTSSRDRAIPDVLGIGEIVADLAGSEIIRHVLHLLKAPLETTLRQTFEAAEGPPYVALIEPDGTHTARLATLEDWRSRFNPSQEHRVMVFLHGFNTTIERSLPLEWVRALAPRYTAILGYNHPTFTRDPLRNAADLLAQIPADVRLNVDLVAHSRGGLVARSLVELQPTYSKFNVRSLLTCGSPHAGTLLANHDRWDRLVSIGFTAVSWLSTASGVGSSAMFLTRGLELLLRAGSQFLFDLPGVIAMDPDSDFLKQLNAPSDIAQRVRYAAVTSQFNPASMAQRNFSHALTAMAAQVFLRAPNDLIVPTESMHSIDLPTSPLGSQIFQSDIDHFSYFNRPDVFNFAETFLLST